MFMKKLLGRNNKYPETIETWKLGEPVPSWISDVANIKGLSEKGEPILDIREGSGGEYEIITSGTNQVLVKARSKEDYICFGGRRIFVLTEKQMDLLYG